MSTWILLMMGCDVLWISPNSYDEYTVLRGDLDGDGFTKEEQDCDDTNDLANPSGTEIYGNGFDDDCDGLSDPGNGTDYFDFSIGDSGTKPYWELYSAESEEPLSMFLSPVEKWEFSFHLIQPSQQNLTDDQYFFLFGRDDFTLGYRPNGSGVEFIWQFDGDEQHYFIVAAPDVSFQNNTVITFQWEGDVWEEEGACLIGEDIGVYVDNQQYDVQVDFEGELSSLCNYSESVSLEEVSPVTFADSENTTTQYEHLGAMIDDLVVIQGEISSENRQQIVNQIKEPSPDFSRPTSMVWITVDDYSGDCSEGFVDEVGLVNASWMNSCEQTSIVSYD